MSEEVKIVMRPKDNALLWENWFLSAKALIYPVVSTCICIYCSYETEQIRFFAERLDICEYICTCNHVYESESNQIVHVISG